MSKGCCSFWQLAYEFFSIYYLYLSKQPYPHFLFLTMKCFFQQNIFSKLSVASDEYIGNSDLVGVYQTQRVYVKKFQCTLSHHSTFSKERLYRLKQVGCFREARMTEGLRGKG